MKNLTVIILLSISIIVPVMARQAEQDIPIFLGRFSGTVQVPGP